MPAADHGQAERERYRRGAAEAARRFDARALTAALEGRITAIAG